MDKRTFLKTAALAGIAGLVATPDLSTAKIASPPEGPVDKFCDAQGNYVLPELPYPQDALEPFIDKQTLEIHHQKHHAGYVKGLNTAVAKVKDALAGGDFGLIKHWEKELAFHGAGHFLHTMYWNNMSGSKTVPGQLTSRYITASFGSFDAFSAYFKAATNAVEASGWGILAYNPANDSLGVLQSEKHQNLSQWISVPLLVCDVWEHAYYLKYQNKRGDYMEAFMQIVNWDVVETRLSAAVKK